MMFNQNEYSMTQEEVREAVKATRARTLKISTEDKIKMNCSHRNDLGKLSVVGKVIKVTNGEKMIDKKVLQCTICKSLIEQISEAEYRNMVERLPYEVDKIINYIKAFDRKWTEEEREFLFIASLTIKHLMVLFESTVQDARRKKDNGQTGPRKMITSGSIFGQRY